MGIKLGYGSQRYQKAKHVQFVSSLVLQPMRMKLVVVLKILIPFFFYWKINSAFMNRKKTGLSKFIETHLSIVNY